MFTDIDKQQIIYRGSKIEEVEQQVHNFQKGFPFLQVVKPAVIGDGITYLDNKQCEEMIELYEEALGNGVEPLKFVPASGAATRMFQSLYAFREQCTTNDQARELLQQENQKSVRQFFDHLYLFAFYPALIRQMEDIKTSDGSVKYIEILDTLLTSYGLNYSFLPKGLLKFHRYGDHGRTPVEEHMVEGALYGANLEGKVRIHFTVSPEHLPFFETQTSKAAKELEPVFNVKFEITFSEQKPSTDTIAVNPENEPFRSADGSLLFRPGGHGALLENLNDLNGDLLFIKNIDNVVPDSLKETTVRYKKVLAGILVYWQRKIFKYLQILEERVEQIPDQLLAEMNECLEKSLCTMPAQDNYYTDKRSLIHYLKMKLNRPIRVAGMVKNEGEPGGGPFWAIQQDGSVTLQIVESSQIDGSNLEQQEITALSTHFNPVDLVCGVRNWKGEKFNLLLYRDPQTGFISNKSKDGKPLKAQELPGLWNGAMADWITVFVEVPPITFNPVKTINDLLRTEHQSG